jgi:hypothetical protein
MKKFALWLVLVTSFRTAHSFNDVVTQQDHPPVDASPQCRQNALQVLDGHFGDALGERYCHRLSYEHKQLLALELTKCHLDEMRQATFETPCQSSPQECLTQLSNLGVQTYTVFKINVEQYCFKLNHDLMILQQQEAGLQLQRTAKQASLQLAEMLEQQGEMKDEYSHLYSSLREEQFELHTSLLEQAVQRQEVQENQLFEMQLQRQELHDLSNAVGQTAAQLKPLLSLDEVLSWISGGFYIANLLVYMYVTINLQWILTIPRCFRSCRRTLWRLAMFEFFLQCCVIWQIEDETTTIEPLMQSVRVVSLTLQATVYVFSFLMSFFTKQPSVARNAHHQELMEITKNLKDTAEQVQRQLDEYEENLTQILREQRYRQQQQVAIQNQPRRHDEATETLPAVVHRNLPDQVLFRPVGHVAQSQIRNIVSNTAALVIPSRHQEALDHSLPGRVLMSSPVLATPHRTQSPVFFFDAISDTTAVTPSPQRDVHEQSRNSALVGKKHARAESDELEPPSKKQRGRAKKDGCMH